jgi:sugar diacid utilization regulator
MATPAHAEIPIIQEVLQSLGLEQPLGRTLELIARRVSEIAGFGFCGIILPIGDWGGVQMGGSHGFPRRYEERLTQMYHAPLADPAMAGSPTLRAMQQGRTVVLEDVLRDETFRPWRELAIEFGYRSLVSVPLVWNARVVGVLNGYSDQPRRFTDGEISVVETLAGQAALAVRLATLVDAQHETIATLQHVNEELERHRAVLERAHEIHLRLTQAVIAGAGFEAVAQTLAELIGRRVEVVDAAGELICASEAASGPTLASLLAAAIGSTTLSAGVTALGEDGAAVIGPIRIDSELLGYVIAETGAEEQADVELDVRAVEHAATVLALEIVKERVARSTEDRLRSDFLFDLVNGRDDDETRIGERARHHGLAIGRPYRVVVIELDGWGAHRERAALSETAATELRARMLRALERTLDAQAPGSLMSQMGDVITAAVPTEALADAPRALKALVAALDTQLAAIAPGLRLSSGIGSAARGAGAFVASHREAQQCLAVLRRLGRTGEALTVDELGVMRLLLDTNQPEELTAFMQRVLGPALERDRDSDGALIETLGAYLRCNCDVRACAAELYVHVNTVRYRLRRIEELCRVDLRAPHDLLQVTIAHLVLRLTRPLEEA